MFSQSKRCEAFDLVNAGVVLVPEKLFFEGEVVPKQLDFNIN